MHTVKVSLGKRSYKIIIGNKILDKTGALIKKLVLGDIACIITNQAIKNSCAKFLLRSLQRAGIKSQIILVPDSEKSKSFEIASGVLGQLASIGKSKRVLIVALGGGVIGDLAGFVASSYKRGVALVQIPTTLLAQVDSSIGGKNALDLPQGKNLIGTFYQPSLVLSDVSLLKTLSNRQIKSGLAEVIKYGIIKEKSLFDYLCRNMDDLLDKKSAALEHIVERSSAIKARVVEADETEEKGIRTVLNFGHTIGHAIENAGGYTGYSHGEAIALGMLVASRISLHLELIDKKTLQEIEELINKAGLPAEIKNLKIEDIMEALAYDKKFIGTKNRFVLIKGIGKTHIHTNIPLAVIKRSVGEIITD